MRLREGIPRGEFVHRESFSQLKEQRDGEGEECPLCQEGPFGQVPVKTQSKNRLLGPPAKKGNGKFSLITLN